MGSFKKNYTPAVALQKIKQYCAYQERCHQEVKTKLYDFGLSTPEVENIIATLIEENYINEERFATLFAGGKFRMKQWGRNRIKYELKQKQVSPANIKKAMLQIDEDEYEQTLQQLFDKYFAKQKGVKQIKILKTKKYLMQKGFEIDVINLVAKKGLMS